MRAATRAAIALVALPTLLPAQRFIVTDSSVRQGAFEAVALSRDSIVSSYPRAAREVRFRFSINGLENEFPGGTEHTIYLRPHGRRLVTSLYTFGVEDAPPPPTPEESASSEEGTVQVTFRVDLRHVLRALRERGRWQPPLGAPITRGGPLRVYVLGDPEPLTWDYARLRPGSRLELRDADGDGIYEGTVPIATQYARPLAADGRAVWARRLDLSRFPALASSQRIQDATYRLSLEELRQLVRDDGALSAGAKWPGVWTRDISLSALLSLAIVAPDAVRRSLMAKVDSAGRIIQDTGTGGSWPISSDRMVWTLAAWEVYAVTGDRAWLRQAYDIARRSAQADLHALPDPATGMFNGESSFMDWREQSYPRWMQPADIFQSQNLGTNAVHYGSYRALSRMAAALGEPSARWDAVADTLGRAIRRGLWNGEWFAQFRYGRVSYSVSPRSDGLGEALSIVTGMADSAQRATLARHAPVTTFGVPTFWPFIPGERFYHNATVWPFVSAYWTWASADAGNTLGVQRGLDDATRTTALFLTNKENFVSSTGHYDGTALNSDRQLWSVAGTLAGTYRVLFGMRMLDDRVAFHPMVPPSYGGERTLTGLRYRDATITVRVTGYGDAVAGARLDGRPVERAEVPASLVGPHALDIVMNGQWPAGQVNEVPSRFAPPTPHATLSGTTLSWRPVGPVTYRILRSGYQVAETRDTSARVGERVGLLEEYQVLAVDSAGLESHLSEPVRNVAPGDGEIILKPRRVALERAHSGYTGAGYATLSRTRNREVAFEVMAPARAVYALDLRYANGNGPVNTEDKAAIRTVIVNGDTAGVVVMPQRGVNGWADWGWSSVVRISLRLGANRVVVVYSPLDENMNRRENTALLDQLRLTRIALRALRR